MGYFDALTDTSFKTDSQGRDVFYPGGVLGKGYILQDKQQHDEYRRFLKRMYLVIVPGIILLQISFGVLPNLILLPCFIIWYTIKSRKMVKNLEVSEEKLTHREVMNNSARSHNLPTLIILSICSFIFVVGGLLMMIQPDTRISGAFCAIFFGACGFVIGKMTYLKIRKN